MRHGLERASCTGADCSSTVTRVYLVRHGQTALNVAGVLRGHLDPPLDEVGVEQARRLGSTLGDRGVTLVVSSTLRRALETSRPIATRAGLGVVTDSRWVDRDCGLWAGLGRDVAEAEWGSIEDAPGVEPSDAVRARASAALDDVGQWVRGGVAVIVSHDVVIRLALVDLDRDLGDPDQLPQETDCFNGLELRGESWKVVSLNELPGGLTRSRPDNNARPGRTVVQEGGVSDGHGR